MFPEGVACVEGGGSSSCGIALRYLNIVRLLSGKPC